MKEIVRYNFDGKRVRFDGRCMTKFEIAYHLDHIKPYFCYTSYYDVYSYKELADLLRGSLS